MIKTEDKATLQEKFEGRIGETITVYDNLGRGKIKELSAVILEVYEDFIVLEETDPHGGKRNRTISIGDLLTDTVQIS